MSSCPRQQPVVQPFMPAEETGEQLQSAEPIMDPETDMVRGTEYLTGFPAMATECEGKIVPAKFSR